MDPLESLLRPATRVLNRNIHELTPARELCAELAGTVAAVRVKNTGLAMYFMIAEDAVQLASDSSEEPDIAISGSILTLARVAGGGENGRDLVIVQARDHRRDHHPDGDARARELFDREQALVRL